MRTVLVPREGILMTTTTADRIPQRADQQRADQQPAGRARRGPRTRVMGAAGLLLLVGLGVGLLLTLGGGAQTHGRAAGKVARCETAVNRGLDELVVAARHHTLDQTRAGLARRLGPGSVPYRTLSTVFAELRPLEAQQPAGSGGPGAAPLIASQCDRAAS